MQHPPGESWEQLPAPRLESARCISGQTTLAIPLPCSSEDSRWLSLPCALEQPWSSSSRADSSSAPGTTTCRPRSPKSSGSPLTRQQRAAVCRTHRARSHKPSPSRSAKAAIGTSQPPSRRRTTARSASTLVAVPDDGGGLTVRGLDHPAHETRYQRRPVRRRED